MYKKTSGKSHRKGISMRELFRRFPDDATAEAWFIERRWPTGIACPHCGSTNIQTGAKHKTMPYRCREKQCAKRFSAKTGTVMERSKLGFQVWMIATYLLSTSLKSVSSMKLHRDLEINQRSAWFFAHRRAIQKSRLMAHQALVHGPRRRKVVDNRAISGVDARQPGLLNGPVAHRLRVALSEEGGIFSRPVEVDESYFGGRRRNMSNARRKELADTGRGAVGKTAVVGVKDRATKQVAARVVERTDKATLQGFVIDHAAPGATVYTDDASACESLPFNHDTVKHSLAEYVKGDVHTNGIESLWSILKRAHKGTFHKLSP